MRIVKGYKVSAGKAPQTKSQLRRLAKLATRSCAREKNGATREATTGLVENVTPSNDASKNQGHE